MDKEKLLFFTFFLALVGLSCLFFFSDNIRNKISNKSQKPFRKIIASIEADLSEQGNKYKVLKIQSEKGLFVEIYNANSNYNKVAEFSLFNAYDGHLTIEGQATNLALKDLDGDQITEIIAPSFSKSQEPKVHIFKFNLPLLTFEEITHLDLPIGS